MNVSFGTIPTTLIIYYRFNEINDGTYTQWVDSITPTIFMNPTTKSPSYQLMNTVQMREIYLKICPEGYYAIWDDS